MVTRDGVEWHYDPDSWYFAIPAIARLRSKGLRLDSAVTVLVGDNVSGKSTLVEAVATAWHATLTGAQAQHWLPGAGQEDADLHRHLDLTGQRPRPHGACSRCSATWRMRGRRFCSPPTRRCWPLAPERRCSNSDRTESAAPGGRVWRWCGAGRPYLAEPERFLRHL
ncbi:MAG TPA: hypothetical protein VGJ13_20315 [Pseudonocardiaceae bacterium]